MNEFKRCIRVFSHSPFKVRLMLLRTNHLTKRRRGTPLHFCVIYLRYTARPHVMP